MLIAGMVLELQSLNLLFTNPNLQENTFIYSSPFTDQMYISSASDDAWYWPKCVLHNGVTLHNI